MALNDGANVHKSQYLRIFIDFCAGDFPLYDFAEYAVVTHGAPLLK
jgi:hypothetical protein